MGPSVSIVVLTYNRCDSLRVLLSRLAGEARAQTCELVVVDNHSDDGTERMLQEEFTEVVAVRMKENIGVAARNEGVRRASGEIVVALDDDVHGLTAAALAHIRARFAASPRLGALNFQVRDEAGRLCNWVHHRPLTDAAGRFATYEITEGAVAFRRQAAMEAGLYWERFFISHEGPDLAFRIMNSGYTVEYDGAVTVVHRHESRSRAKWRFYYYDTRNQFWLAARNLPAGYACRYLARGLAGTLYYSLRDGYLVWWMRGVWDGLRGIGEARRSRRVWTPETSAAVRAIDRNRPRFWRLVWMRLRQAANRLDG